LRQACRKKKREEEFPVTLWAILMILILSLISQRRAIGMCRVKLKAKGETVDGTKTICIKIHYERRRKKTGKKKKMFNNLAIDSLSNLLPLE